jgi:serine acetyltransferase
MVAVESVGANSQVLRNDKAGSTVNGVPATVLAR